MYTNSFDLFGIVLVFYCCIPNCHKLSSLKQHPLVSLQFCRSEVWWGKMGFSAETITRLLSSCQLYWVLIRKHWVKTLFQTHNVGGIRLLVVVRLRSTFSCWPLFTGHSQLLPTWSPQAVHSMDICFEGHPDSVTLTSSSVRYIC